jgi:hypothetical protein
MEEKVRTRCTYRLLDNGIHEFVMLETSRGAVDDFIDSAREMMEAAGDSVPTPTLFDTQVGIQPINYIFTEIRNLMKEHPTTEQGKLAMIMRPNALLTAIKALMNMFPKMKVKFFGPEERDDAITWLLAE